MFSLLFSLIVLLYLPFYFDTFSPISILPARIAFLIPFDFLQTLQVYITDILFVVLAFLFQSFGPFLERLPLFPKPLIKPRRVSLALEPRERGCVAERALCFAVPTD